MTEPAMTEAVEEPAESVVESVVPAESDADAAEIPAGTRTRLRRRPRSHRAGARGPAFAGLRPVLVVIAVALSLTAIAAFVQLPQPKTSEYGTTTEPIGSSILLCPEPGSGGNLDVRVSAAVVPGQPGQDADLSLIHI